MYVPISLARVSFWSRHYQLVEYHVRTCLSDISFARNKNFMFSSFFLEMAPQRGG